MGLLTWIDVRQDFRPCHTRSTNLLCSSLYNEHVKASMGLGPAIRKRTATDRPALATYTLNHMA